MLKRLQTNTSRLSKRPWGWAAVFPVAALGLLQCSDSNAASGQTQARKTEKKGMDVTKLRLTAASREKSGHLYPEQSAFFDFSLVNSSPAPVQVPTFYGNETTPVYRVYDSAGHRMNELGIRDLERRYNADMGDLPAKPKPPRMMTIAPGKSVEGWVDLWSYRAPLPAGHYQFAIAHQLSPGAPHTESNRVPFQVVDAGVAGVALSYGEHDHSTSLLAWIAEAAGDAESRILMRQSATDKHTSAQRSGMPIGVAPKGTRVALGAKPGSGIFPQESWLAVVRGGNSLEMIQTFEAGPRWTSEPIALPLTGAQPDRGEALFLATGGSTDNGVLTGVRVTPESSGQPWQIPLGFRPTRSVCIFDTSGPLSLVLARAENGTTHLSLIGVDENGDSSLPLRDIWSGEGELLDLSADLRPGSTPSVTALISEAQRPDHLRLVRITANGETVMRDLGPVPGWPMIADRVRDPDDKAGQRTIDIRRAAKVRRAQSALAQNSILVAIVDEEGSFYGGALGVPLIRMAGAEEDRRVIWPHIAVLGEQAFFSGFTARGSLAHLGAR
jgi:hypothetical protein